jgi:cell wall assembly regulator SMI1
MEHVREIRKGALVEMVAVMEAEYESECPRNVKEIL